MKRKVLILDLDGVLIITPPWKADRIHLDGYSDFNEVCVNTLNQLLSQTNFEIWLSSSRRAVKTLTEFNQIFSNRGIDREIVGFLPEYIDCNNRKEEIVRFIQEFKISEFLIIDDDKSLGGIADNLKPYLVMTELTKGLDKEKFEEAIEKMRPLL